MYSNKVMALQYVIFIILAILGFITIGLCANNKDYSALQQDYNNIEKVAAINNTQTEISRNSLRIKRDVRHNLCDLECNCSNDNNFVSVHCDFTKNQEYVLGAKKSIPSLTTSLIIKLGPSSRLRIEPNFFENNKVHRILIHGNDNHYPTRKEHIEIRSQSFDGNSAPYPEIEITNCHTLVFRANAIRGEFILNVTNCHDVIVYPNAFLNTSFYGNFNDIEDLRIHEKAFHNSQAKINIVRSKIENLYRFEAPLRKIKFDNSTIGNVTAGTFDVLDIDTIIFDHCKIGAFNTKAITEKLYSRYLSITGGSVGLIENEAFAGSGITELILSNNKIDTIQSNAIFVTSVDILITGNQIIRTGEEWLRVKEWSNITISNNSFGDFNSMQLDKTANPKQCIFIRNLITKANHGSLNITNPHCMISETLFHQYCTCNTSWLNNLSERDLNSESYCRVQDDLKYCFNSSSFNVLKFKKEVCEATTNIFDCAKSRGFAQINGEFIKPEEIEEKSSNILHYIIIASVIAIILILILTILYIVCKCLRRRASVEGTTLTEGEQEVIRGTLKILKKKYPQHIYHEVNRCINALIQKNTTETQRVQIVSEILNSLKNLDDPGDDFVAFTAYLGRYLKPNEPIYDELNLPESNGNDLNQQQTDLGHIYNEVQHPLLTNHYESPVDRNDNVDLYSDPVTSDRDNIPLNDLNTTNRIKQQPSTSKNLPDVLNQSKPNMTNVQKIAQNFGNNPNFHITRSPNTQRHIPEYTIPNKKVKNIDSHILQSTAPTSSDSRSNHSGGSDVTVQMDDIIDYVDS